MYPLANSPRWARQGASCSALVGKYEGKSAFGRPRLKWEDSIEMGQQEMGSESGIELSRVRTGTGGWASCTECR